MFSVFGQFSLIFDSPTTASTTKTTTSAAPTTTYARFLSGATTLLPRVNSVFNEDDKLNEIKSESRGWPKMAENDVTETTVKKRSATSQQKQSSSSNQLLKFLKSFNNLTTRNRSTCQFEYVSNMSANSQLYVNSTTRSCFCQTIYYIMNSYSATTTLLFDMISPMFFGKILYAPNTPAYAKLIKRANATFENADTLLKLVGSLADVLNFTLDSLDLNLQDGIDNFKEYIRLAQTFLNSNVSSDQTSNLDETILQTKIIIEELYFIQNLGYCIELDKFVPYNNEEEAVNVGGDLLANSNMWGVIAFNNPEVSGANGVGRLPDIVSYKIRMNSSLTHNTIYTQDTIYYYGPSNCLGCNSYFMYGFIYMQDMLEKGTFKNLFSLFFSIKDTYRFQKYSNFIPKIKVIEKSKIDYLGIL